MSPKDKAIELLDNFRLNVIDYEGSGMNKFNAKQCALIAVDLVLDILNQSTLEFEYWEEVKTKIEEL